MMPVLTVSISIPTPGPLDIGPQVAADKSARGMLLLGGRLVELAGGFTFHLANGVWKSPEGKILQEPTLWVVVACPNQEVLAKVKEFFLSELGPLWGQQSVYFQTCDGAEILDCKEPKAIVLN